MVNKFINVAHGAKKLSKASYGLLLSNALLAGLQFLTVVMISRFFGPSMTGTYGLSQSYIIPATFLAFLALRQQILINTNNKYSLADFYVVRILFSLLSFFLALIVTIIFETSEVTKIAALLALIKLFEGCIEISVSTLQKYDQANTIAIISITRFILTITSLILSLYLWNDIHISLGIFSLCFAMHFLLVEYSLSKKFERNTGKFFTTNYISWKNRFELIRTGIPVAAGLMLGGLHLGCARIALERFDSIESLGHFTAVFQMMMIANIVVVALANGILPSMASSFRKKDHKAFINHCISGLSLVIGMIIIGSIICFFLGDKIIILIYGPSFKGLSSFLMITSISSIFFFCNAFTVAASVACGVIKQQIHASFFGLIVVLITSSLLVPNLSSTGAMLAVNAGSGTQMFILWFYMLKNWKKNLNIKIKDN